MTTDAPRAVSPALDQVDAGVQADAPVPPDAPVQADAAAPLSPSPAQGKDAARSDAPAPPSAPVQAGAAAQPDAGPLPSAYTAGALVLAGTPIGNVDDASARLCQLLQAADVVAAEDTRRLRSLAARLGVTVKGKVVSCFDHNELARADQLLDTVEAGGLVVLVTDAGMPAVSDPGYRLVARAVERRVAVTAAPGPSAVITALALSGLPTDRFTFEGFAPRKPGDRRRLLTSLSEEPRTMVFFEAPHRIAQLLADMADALGGGRLVAVCRELTKRYEEVLRGPVAEIADQVAARCASDQGFRGEIALVVAGRPPQEAQLSVADVLPRVQELLAQGVRLKEAVADVAQLSGVSKRDLYNAAVLARSD